MASDTKQVQKNGVQGPLPDEWQKRAEEAARRFGLSTTTPEEVGSPEQVEQQLIEAEQPGGE